MKSQNSASKNSAERTKPAGVLVSDEREVAAMWNRTRAQVVKLSSHYEKVRKAETGSTVNFEEDRG